MKLWKEAQIPQQCFGGNVACQRKGRNAVISKVDMVNAYKIIS